MPRYDFTTKRLYTSAALEAGDVVPLDRRQCNYLVNVMRMKSGDKVLLFNGLDGEWLARLEIEGRNRVTLTPLELVRCQTVEGQLIYIFAPLKKGRLDYMVQKAVEMGASRLQPVITDFTQTSRLNSDRMRTNVVEAAEQCGILNLPQCMEPEKLTDLLQDWPDDIALIYCDEGEAGKNPLKPLAEITPGPIAVLIGPEGGFSKSERQLLRSRRFVTPIPLGPRVLRADTAAVAALAVVQATIGDWH